MCEVKLLLCVYMCAVELTNTVTLDYMCEVELLLCVCICVRLN